MNRKYVDVMLRAEHEARGLTLSQAIEKTDEYGSFEAYVCVMQLKALAAALAEDGVKAVGRDVEGLQNKVIVGSMIRVAKGEEIDFYEHWPRMHDAATCELGGGVDEDEV